MNVFFGQSDYSSSQYSDHEETKNTVFLCINVAFSSLCKDNIGLKQLRLDKSFLVLNMCLHNKSAACASGYDFPD